jgi:hypothetical protein
MSSPASTAPAVLSYLAAQIPLSPDLPASLLGGPVTVTYGILGTDIPPCFIVIGATVAAVNTPFQMTGSGGAGWLEEHYRVEIQVSAFEGGSNFQDVTEAAYTMWQAVSSTVRADPSLGALVTSAFPASADLTLSWETNHKGPVAEIRAELEVFARI